MEEEGHADGWCRDTDMEFTVVNHLNPARTVVKRARNLVAGMISRSVTCVARCTWNAAWLQTSRPRSPGSLGQLGGRPTAY